MRGRGEPIRVIGVDGGKSTAGLVVLDEVGGKFTVTAAAQVEPGEAGAAVVRCGGPLLAGFGPVAVYPSTMAALRAVVLRLAPSIPNVRSAVEAVSGPHMAPTAEVAAAIAERLYAVTGREAVRPRASDWRMGLGLPCNSAKRADTGLRRVLPMLGICVELPSASGRPKRCDHAQDAAGVAVWMARHARRMEAVR